MVLQIGEVGMVACVVGCVGSEARFEKRCNGEACPGASLSLPKKVRGIGDLFADV